MIDLTADSDSDDEEISPVNERNAPRFHVPDEGLPVRRPSKPVHGIKSSPSKSLPSHIRANPSPQSSEYTTRSILHPDRSTMPVAKKTTPASRFTRLNANGSNPSGAQAHLGKRKGTMESPRSAPRDSQPDGVTHRTPSRRMNLSPPLRPKSDRPTKRRQSSKGNGERSSVNSEAEEIEGLLEEEDDRLHEETPSHHLSSSSNTVRPGVATRSTSNGSQHAVPSVAGLEESLRGFDRDMKETHAATVRYLLHDAKEANRTMDQFCDDKSPFKSLKSVQVKPGSALPDGAVSQVIESFVRSSLLSYG